MARNANHCSSCCWIERCSPEQVTSTILTRLVPGTADLPEAFERFGLPMAFLRENAPSGLRNSGIVTGSIHWLSCLTVAFAAQVRRDIFICNREDILSRFPRICFLIIIFIWTSQNPTDASRTMSAAPSNRFGIHHPEGWRRMDQKRKDLIVWWHNWRNLKLRQ